MIQPLDNLLRLLFSSKNYFIVKKIYNIYPTNKLFWTTNYHQLHRLKPILHKNTFKLATPTNQLARLKKKHFSLFTHKHFTIASPFELSQNNVYPNALQTVPTNLTSLTRGVPNLPRRLTQLKNTLTRWKIFTKLHKKSSNLLSVNKRNNFTTTSFLLKRSNAYENIPNLTTVTSTPDLKVASSLNVYELFLSIQNFRQRKFRKHTFIQRYLPFTKMKNFVTNLRCFTNENISCPKHSIMLNINLITGKKFHVTSKKTTDYTPVKLNYKYLCPNLGIRVFKALPLPTLLPIECVLFTPALNTNQTVSLRTDTTALPTLPFTTLKNLIDSSEIYPLMQHYQSRFKIGFTMPLLITTANSLIQDNNPTALQNQLSKYDQQLSFVTTLTTKKFLSLLAVQHKILYTNLGPNNATLEEGFKSSLQTFRGTLQYLGLRNDEQLVTSTPIRLTHIRFKPGYSRQWRAFRNEFKEFFSLKKTYQYRLTTYIAQLALTQRKLRVGYNVLLLKHGIVASKLAADVHTANTFVSVGLVYLNGFLTTNANTYLLVNDFVQLIIFLKYYTVYKIQWYVNLQSRKQLSRLLWKRGKNWKKNNFNFPRWTLEFSTTFFDTPLSLEADYFTSSFYVLNQPFSTANTLSPYPQILPLYNWKYIV